MRKTKPKSPQEFLINKVEIFLLFFRSYFLGEKNKEKQRTKTQRNFLGILFN